MGELYRLDFPNGKSYIGITTKTAKQRFRGHAKCAQRGEFKGLLYAAWRKHGEPVLKVLAVLENYDLAATEIRAIKVFNTLVPNGYNVTIGGELAPSSSPEVARRISNSMKGKTKSNEHKEKLRRSSLANGSGLQNKGRRMSQETKEKLRKASSGNTNRRGQKSSDETKLLLSLSHTGHRHSDDTKRKMAISQQQRRSSEKANDNAK